jgi:hypothetical protein
MEVISRKKQAGELTDTEYAYLQKKIEAMQKMNGEIDAWQVYARTSPSNCNVLAPFSKQQVHAHQNERDSAEAALAVGWIQVVLLRMFIDSLFRLPPKEYYTDAHTPSRKKTFCWWGVPSRPQP